MPYLRQHLLSTVLSDDPATGGAAKCIETLDSYGLSRDDFMENMRELQFISPEKRSGPTDLKDKYETIDTKTKTAFTRLYNAGSHGSQALVAAQAVSGKGKKGKAGSTKGRGDKSVH